MTDYGMIALQAEALVAGIPHRIANLANISALLFSSMETINWAGFYFLEGNRLVLGPFQGKPACVEIPYGKGVCGTAAAEDAVQLVSNVHLFPGHIACDHASQSEIVIPLHAAGEIRGVLDIDSPEEDRFSQADQAGLEDFVRALEEAILWA